MNLDVSALGRAIAQLEEALLLCDSTIAKLDPRLPLHLRAAAIQAFEFTYELSIKLLKRYLELLEENPATVDRMTFNEIIRRGYETGMLNEEIKRWRDFRQDRGVTSHTYDEQKAQFVFAHISTFLIEAKFLYQQLLQRNSA